jgi:hypothetical protein
MLEKLMPLTLPPGFYGNGTEYQAKNRWLEGELVRFWAGTIRPIGGWSQVLDNVGAALGPVSGCPIGAYAYKSNGGDLRGAIGTSTHLYAITQGALVDISPAALTPGSCAGSFAAGTGAYGAGLAGAGPYGGSFLAGTLVDSDTWSLDSFGDYLVGVLAPADGLLYLWDGTASPAAAITAAEGTTPVDNAGVVVTPERFLVAIGADGDGRLIRWASQETTDIWDDGAGADSSAGAFPISTAGSLMTGRRYRHQTLLWTDVDLWSMTYNGDPDFLYSFNQESDNCGLLSPRAVVTTHNAAIWMGKNSFYTYDGFVQPLACDVADRIFNDLNYVNRARVWATTISEFDEAWWFYPSRGSDVPDKYVVYNYRENSWVTGSLERSTGFDRGTFRSPIWVDNDGAIWGHEDLAGDYDGVDDDPFVLSGPIELDQGDRILRIQHIIPDQVTAGTMVLSLRTALYPMGPFSDSADVSLLGSSPVSIRATARQVQIRVTGAQDTNWRLGTLRFGVRPQGRR